MRTMSWSRYHTFTRIRTHLHSRSAKRMRRAARAATQALARASTPQAFTTQAFTTQALMPQASAARCEPEYQSGDTPGGFSRGFLTRISRSLSRIFRTGRLRNRTDI